MGNEIYLTIFCVLLWTTIIEIARNLRVYT